MSFALKLKELLSPVLFVLTVPNEDVVVVAVVDVFNELVFPGVIAGLAAKFELDIAGPTILVKVCSTSHRFCCLLSFAGRGLANISLSKLREANNQHRIKQ